MKWGRRDWREFTR